MGDEISLQGADGRDRGFCATVGQMTEEMIKQYLENHFEPSANDDFKMEPDESADASFRRRVSGLSVRNTNPPALAGGCLVTRTNPDRSAWSSRLT